MPYDYGLAGGIGQGIQQGLLTYMKAKQLSRENQIQNLTAGVETDEDGNLKLNDQMQQQRDTQGLLAHRQGDLLQPHTPTSESLKTTAKGFLNSQQPGLGDQSITDEMTGQDVKDIMPNLIKPTIVGNYGVQAANAKGQATTQAATIHAGGQIKAAQIGADAKESVADKNNAGKQTSKENSDLWKFSDRYSKDPEITKATAALQSANTMDKLLATNESPSILMAKIAALRAAGLNRVTNFEISSFNGDQAAASRLQQALQTLQEGNLTEGNVGEFKNAVKVLKDSSNQVIANKKAYYNNLAQVTGLDQKKTGLLMGDQPQQQVQQGLIYDGSTPVPPNASPEQKQMRIQYLQKKAQGG